MQSRNDIGFGKRIRGCWLDSALELAARGVPFEECRSALAKEIAADNSGQEAIRKIQTALRRVWFTPPDYARPLHADALDLFKRNHTPSSRFLLNWGMVVVAYPFIGDVAEALGRLLKLQGAARRADIERRIREQRGDRDFVGRIVRYNISSFLDWQLIKEAASKGSYTLPRQIAPPSADHVRWLLEAVVTSRGVSQLPFAQLRTHPILFPFKLESITSSVLQGTSRLKIQRESLSDEVVILEAKP
jgi:hypothetical protein